MLDKRISMDMAGDLRRFTQFQTAQSIPIAAANEGGAAGIGAGLGAGMSIGQTMAEAMKGGQPAGAGGGGAGGGNVDAMAMLEKLHDLMTKGILSREEFEAKKAELLKKI
jgi:membrane protease subunit (stomatin/prohibitin family)